MSRILVVEKDAEFSNQLAVALRAQGHTIDAVASSEAGQQHAAARAPQLVLVSGMLPGAPELLNRFSKRNGGPGSAVIVPAQMASEISARQFGADMILPRPATGAALAKVLGLLPSAQAAPATEDPALLPDVGAQLTSQQIFGDVLAEVEADVDKRNSAPQPGPSSPAPSQPAPSQPAPSQPAPSQPAPAAPAAQAPRPPSPVASGSAARAPSPPPRRRRADDDIDRKLEETLSGFFPGKLKAESEKTKKPKAPTKPRRAPSTDEIDDLLDKTLSSLELPRAAKKRPEARPSASPRPAAPKPSAPAPTSQAPTPQPSATRPAPATSEPPAPKSPAEPSSPRPAPPPFSPPSPPDLPSAAETLRLDAPRVPPEEPRPVKPKADADRPPASEAPKPPAPSPPTFSRPPFGQEESPGSSSWTPDDASPADEDILQTGTFDLPALEPLPDQPPPPLLETEPPAPAPEAEAPPASLEHDDGYRPTVEFSPPPLLETEPLETEPPAPEPPLEPPAPEPSAPQPPTSFELPDLPPAEGWSVSSFEDEATPESPMAAPPELPEAPEPPVDEADRPPSFAPPEVPSAFAEEPAPPASFEASGFGAQSFETPAPPSDSAPPEPPADEEESYSYPTDFESAFALPAGEKEEGFSPDPTETVEPEDTASLQRTLEGVLQIRNGSSASAKAGIPFGDYRLLDRVAVGGMAEVWRAHRRGVEGFQKIVAIKKILSHLTGSQDFITMFIDEAKLAAQLNHANIIQIYDLGKVEDDFFIAMEFVDGKDLRSIQNRAKDEGVKLPIGLCLMITAAVARALDYAHRKRDFDNRDLGLVHRDVSPQNVLISYEGEIKLCDFGIVKAVAKASSTQMGALKGKLQYMSPEQAWGKEVDARSDIFSLGSVFFELLTGERLFTGDSEIGVLDAVRDCRVQSPRNLNPDVPVEVESIVMRALAATPETRYQTAGEMEKDIATVLEQLRPAVGQSELADMMAELFGPHPSNVKAETPPGGEPESASHLDAEAPPEDEEAGKEAKKKDSKSEKKKREKKKTDAGADTAGGSRTWVIAAIVLIALAAVLAILFFALRSDDSAPSSPAPITAPAAPALDTPPESGDEGALEDGVESDADASGAAVQDATQEGDGPANAVQGDADRGDTTQGGGTDQPSGEDASEGDSAAQAEDESGADYQRLIQEALDSEKKKLEQDYEAERRRLEAELSKVRAEGEEGEGGGGEGDEAGGGGG